MQQITQPIRTEAFRLVDEMFTSATYAQLESLWETKVLSKKGRYWKPEEFNMLEQTFQEMIFILDESIFPRH